MLKPEQISRFKSILEQRHRKLREQIREALLRSDEEQFQKLAGEVHDTEDLALADLLVDLNYAGIDHLIRELREVEDALQRIRDGSYGICVDTGQPIEPDRLEACPTAKRTVKAQEIYEKTHAGGIHPTM